LLLCGQWNGQADHEKRKEAATNDVRRGHRKPPETATR
jgi:hypothetical protein